MLAEIVTVPHRAAALWLEAEVLSQFAAWPVVGEPLERRVTGWTEMWDASAPLTVTLAEHVPCAAAVEMDPALVIDWQDSRTLAATSTGAWTPVAGDRVCFTGTGTGPGRHVESGRRLQSRRAYARSVR